MSSQVLALPKWNAATPAKGRDERAWDQYDRQRQWFVYVLPVVMAVLLTLVPLLKTKAALPFAIVLVPLVLWTALRDTERALYVYCAWCWMDGTIRGIFGGGVVMIAAHDIVLVLICVGWGLQRAANRNTDPIRRPPGTLLVCLFIFLVLAELINPYNGGIVRSLAGLKIHLGPIPLFFLGYDVVRRRSQLRSLFVFLVLATLVISAVSFVQYEKGQKWTNAHFPGTEKILLQNYNPTAIEDLKAGANYKPPGTTGTGGGTGSFAGFAVPLVFVLLLLAGPLRFTTKAKLLFIAVMLGFVVALFINSVRSAVAEAIMGVLLCSVFVGGRLRVRALSVGAFCLVLGLVGYLISQNLTGGGAGVRFASMFADPNRALHEDRHTFMDDLPNLLYHSSMGIGLGSTGAASGHLGPHYGLGFNPFSESYLGCMILETGVIGAVLITVIALFFIWRGFLAAQSVRGPDDRLLLMSMVAILVMILMTFVVAPVLYAAPGSVLFWLSGAMILRVYGLPLEAATARFSAASL